MNLVKSLEHNPTIADFGLVEEKIRGCESAADLGLRENKRRSQAFSRLVLETFFQISSDETDEHIVDGGNDRGIDLIYIDHSNRKISIGTCKTVSNFKNSKKNFPADVVDCVISFVQDLMYHREELLDSVNGSLALKIRQIWEIFSNDRYKISVYLFSNQARLSSEPKQRLLEALSRHEIELFECGLFELCHGLVKHTKPKFTKTLTPHSEGVRGPQIRNTLSGVECSVSLTELVNFCSTQNGNFDDRLIWENVRYFLGIENEVNREIKESLLAGDVQEFWFLNSGVTIVCDQILSMANGCHPFKMVNPQIVNGCQTASVLHSVSEATLADLSHGSVRVRIIQTTNPELIKKIARASNLQSRIGSRDLRANDDFQIQLAEDLRSFGFYYKRKRGSDRIPSGLVPIDSLRVGQMLLAYTCGEPTKAKTNSQEIFGEYYSEAFDPARVNAELIVSMLKIYEQISTRREKALALQKSLAKNSFEETWLVEGHFHVLFVVSELMKRERFPLTDFHNGIKLVNSAVEIVDEFAKTANKAAYRTFRLVKSKPEILKILDRYTGSCGVIVGQLDWLTDLD
ncbi:AIPR family protein [Roseibium sp. SCPC15]|uniref:AIPR family protein n=1 Tax=Roseibium sp. SCP15 TaxID=3141376 RepID=UPI00333D7281